MISFQQGEEFFLNLILEYVPETVYRINRHYRKAKQQIPMIYVKVRNVNFCFGTFKFCSFLILDVHVPAIPSPGLHSFAWNLSPRCETSKLARRPRQRRVETVRLRIRQGDGSRRSKRFVYLLAVLPGAGIDTWVDDLRYEYR